MILIECLSKFIVNKLSQMTRSSRKSTDLYFCHKYCHRFRVVWNKRMAWDLWTWCWLHASAASSWNKLSQMTRSSRESTDLCFLGRKYSHHFRVVSNERIAWDLYTWCWLNASDSCYVITYGNIKNVSLLLTSLKNFKAVVRILGASDVLRG